MDRVSGKKHSAFCSNPGKDICGWQWQGTISNSSIEWTDETWNPTTGCDKVSSGCRFCYAESFSKRLKAMGVEKYADEFAFRMHKDALEQPLSWKKPRYVFVNSMSDLFHEEMDDDFLLRVFDIMRQVPQHRFQVLTKRAERLLEVEERLSLDWPPNVWMGVSVESETYAHRVDLLRQSRAAVKFLSIEPLTPNPNDDVGVAISRLHRLNR